MSTILRMITTPIIIATISTRAFTAAKGYWAIPIRFRITLPTMAVLPPPHHTGTRAAAHGGTTTLVDFAVQTRGASTLAALDAWHEKAAGRTAIDYGFHMILTDLPTERMPELRRLSDEGVTSYKPVHGLSGRDALR